MKKIQKYWGIGLIIMLLASMLVMASPAAAGDLTFTAQGAPSPYVYQLADGTEVTDMAIAADGTTIYAVGNSAYVYKSVNAGVTWTRNAVALSLIHISEPTRPY